MEVTCGAEGRPASPPPPEQSASPPALTSVQASSPCSGLGAGQLQSTPRGAAQPSPAGPKDSSSSRVTGKEASLFV